MGLLTVEITTLIKTDDLGRVHEPEAKIRCQNKAVQIFAPGRGIIPAGLPLEIIGDQGKFVIKRQIQAKSLYDLTVTAVYLGDTAVDLLSPGCRIITLIQHVRDLRIV